MPENAVHQFLIEPAERAPETVALVNASTGLETTRQDLLTGAQQAACFLANQGVVAKRSCMSWVPAVQFMVQISGSQPPVDEQKAAMSPLGSVTDISA